MARPESLRSIPNVGPAIEKDLQLLGIEVPADLRGRSAQDLYDELCVRTSTHQDPCVLDTFMAAVHFVETGESRKWWEFTPLRKATQRM